MGKRPIKHGTEPKLLSSALFIAAERLKRLEQRNGVILSQKEISERTAEYVNQFLMQVKIGAPPDIPDRKPAKSKGIKRDEN